MSKIKVKAINLNHEKVELPFEIEVNEIKTKSGFSPQVQICSTLTEVVIELIKKFLKREKENKMSIGLKALNNMYFLLQLHSLQNDDDYLAIEKELKQAEKDEKLLKIISSKPFNNTWFTYYKDYEEYCCAAEYIDESKKLTKEEWELLKERCRYEKVD